jgi:hypothetical protein
VHTLTEDAGVIGASMKGREGQQAARQAIDRDMALVSDGVHPAELVDVRSFDNAFGLRVGLVFKITGGQHAGAEVMDSAAPSGSPRGKLAEMLRGLGATDWTVDATRQAIGRRCHVVIRHEITKTGKTYPAIAQTVV